MRYIISLLLASTTPALAEVPRVVTDIPPVHALVAQVMGDLGQPELLLDKGASEHDFQLRPSQAAALADAGLIVWVGPELTPWLDRAVDALGEGAPHLRLLTSAGTHVQSYGAAGDHTGHDHAEAARDDHAAGHDDHAHEGEAHDDHAAAEAGHEGHDHSGTDPHAWLDPANAQTWLGVIAAELGRIDPANAPAYTANATAATAALTALDAEVKATLAPAATLPLITQHDAYGYFAGHYGLTIAGSIAVGDASAPGAARLADLRDSIGATPPCLFPEVQHDPALILQLAEETGARVGGALDPVGANLTPGPDAYATLLRGMAQTIAACASP